MKSVLVGIALVGLCTGVASAKNLDTFDAGPFLITANGGTNPEILYQPGILPSGEVLKDARLTTLTRLPPSGVVTASVTTGPDFLEWSNGSGATSTLEIEYGRTAAGPPWVPGAIVPMNEDLTADGAIAFWFIASTDGLNHPMDISLEVTSGINEGTPQTATVTELNFATVNELAWAPVSMLFTSFGAVDMSDVDHVKMTLTSTTTAVDGNIDLFTTDTPGVPEPVTMAMLGLAVAGLGGYIRRRRTA